jgi:hypothetical protein
MADVTFELCGLQLALVDDTCESQDMVAESDIESNVDMEETVVSFVQVE